MCLALNQITKNFSNRDEEDAEELEAWQARRGAEEGLEISPKLSKEETVRLLTIQYDQALKKVSCRVIFPSSIVVPVTPHPPPVIAT